MILLSILLHKSSVIVAWYNSHFDVKSENPFAHFKKQTNEAIAEPFHKQVCGSAQMDGCN